MKRRSNTLIIGLMSGTSADGIDAALVELQGNGTSTRYHLRAFLTHPYPRGLKEVLFSQSDASTSAVDRIAECDFLLGSLFADAARAVARKGKARLRDVDLIGSHGQTIHHLPSEKLLFGKKVRATMQIGNISVIAKSTGVVTVGDFRSGDVAVGGSGAPLVPYFDFITLRSASRNRAALNIGGIANITLLPRGCKASDVRAFDTGPGNMVIDALVRRYTGKEFDKGGEIAARGKIIPGLLSLMADHPYFKERPPKSTGREMFGKKFVGEIIAYRRRAKAEDLIATATEFTALSVYDQYRRYLRGSAPISELIVSGGGAHNRTLMSSLGRYFTGTAIADSSDYGIDPDAKEAICFALLANETIARNPSNIPLATGAKRATILGTIALP